MYECLHEHVSMISMYECRSAERKKHRERKRERERERESERERERERKRVAGRSGLASWLEEQPVGSICKCNITL